MNNQRMNEQQDKRMNIQEKNLRIAQLVYPDADVSQPECGSLGLEDCVRVKRPSKFPFLADYYNNWNDLMPLVVEHEISLLKYRLADFWRADPNISKMYSEVVKNENPQHALADCLLQVLEKGDE